MSTASSGPEQQVHFPGGFVDLLSVFGGGCHNTTVGFIAKDKKCRQFDRQLCVFPWSLSWILPHQLGLSVPDGKSLPSMDNLDGRTRSDSLVCRFLLLLLQELEEQRKAQATSLNVHRNFSVDVHRNGLCLRNSS
jgi:hypothetical protein